ncbi:MAG TPA: GAF domain-containing protein [candidate division Zixibacteria bacterium]|nr:GAF domain-containing protein [candidate division Zixibacteria bacterium]
MSNQKQDKIIIVDDEQRMCESLSALLTGDGYEVESYREAPGAAEAIRRGKVDLVITDIKMPQMSGLDLLKVVKEVDEEIPVILMTGYASLDSAVEAVTTGAYDYLMKPIEFTYLEMAVKRALDKRRSAIERRQLLERLKIATLLQERRISELNALYEAGKSIGSTANLGELLRQLVALASSVTEARVGSIMLMNEDEQTLSIAAAIGLEENVVQSARVPVGESIAGYVAKTGEPLMIADVEKDERFKRTNKDKYGQASLLCAPLVIKNKIIGVINMANKEGGQNFTDNDLKLLTTFAAQAAVAVDDANQFDKNRRRLIEFEILNEISSELSTIESVNRFRTVLVEKLRRVFPIDWSLWFDWDESSSCLILDGASGVDEIPLTESGGIDLGKIMRDKLSLAGIDPESYDYKSVAQMTRLVSPLLADGEIFPNPGAAFMAVPIVKYGELAHLFCLGAEGDKPFNFEDISLARLVISQAAVLFERETSMLNATRLLTMGKMISEISHDLRRPLTTIKGGLQVLHQKWPDMLEADFMKVIEDEIFRANELVRELVDFSNPNKYATEKVDLRRLVIRASELIGPDLRKRDIQFSHDFEDANWEQIINKNQIMEVFLNLFMNSLDAMPDGGFLSVEGLVETPHHKKEPYLAIKVIDTGCGIKKEHLAKIFDRYYTSKDTGTGLGLAVVERIMSAHSGTLAVSSEEGKGTIFTLYFPLPAS